jgi:predicted branched-subunit amino acid permease
MSHWRELIKHPEYRLGMLDMAQVAPGLAAWGLMTGVAMINSGMSLLEALSMTLLVFAGSAQLAAIPLIAAGVPATVILATAWCVNLRFMVFSAHLRAFLMHLPLRARLFVGYLIADNSYVMFTRKYRNPPVNQAEQKAQLAYLLGGCTTSWGSWQLSSLLGIVLAHSVPLHWGLSFAGILALLGVACSLVSTRLRLISAGVAGAAAVAAVALPYKLNIVVAIAAAVAMALLLERISTHKETA